MVTHVPTEARDAIKPVGSSLLTIFLVMAALYFGREVFVPLALAALLSFLLVPVSIRLERWGLPRAFASLLVVFLSLAAVATLGWVMLGQVYSLAIELPQYEQNITQKIDKLHLHSASRLSNTLAMLSNEIRQLRGGTPPPATVPLIPETPRRRTRAKAPASETTPDSNKIQLSATNDQPVTVRIEEPEESVINLANRTLTPFIHPVTTTFVVVIFLGFMLIGREDLRDRCIRLAGRGRMQVTTSTIEDAGRRVGRYLRMQLVVNITLGGVAGLLLWAIGVPNPLLWALLIAVLRFVPYIGILMASAGPLLLAIAVSPHWGTFLWTAFTLLVLEFVTGNIVEPLLYGSSTGLSPIAVLIAAIFWTLLWGLPGLLLSTPLTACLVVIGRQVPRLQFLEVLLGDETALPPSERLYQRLLASNTHEARALLETQFAAQPREAVFDSVVIPALTMLEESRHADELTNPRAEELLQAIEEIVEDIVSRAPAPASPATHASSRFIACIPARDFADEIACELASHVLTPTTLVRVFPAESAATDIFDALDIFQADVICVVGVPPSSLRHIRLRCRHVRTRFPEATVFACVLSEQCDLPNIRARIPTEDAQHVVCSLTKLKEYLSSLLNPPLPPAQAAIAPAKEAVEVQEESADPLAEVQNIDAIDESNEDVFQRLTADLARAFDAPISLTTAGDGERLFWEAHCGLPDEALFNRDNTRTARSCAHLVASESLLVIPDIADDRRTDRDPFFLERGIRFYAGTPLKSHDGTVIGALCVLDTRPRQITDKHKELLVWIAEAVTTAIELQSAEPEPAEPAPVLQPETITQR
jgi:predicted PurR-regulated permease PerM